MHRVVVTGLGAITPVGNDVESFWKGITQGTSGAGPITQFDAGDYDCRFAAEVKGFVPERYMDKKDARRFERYIQFAVAASVQAWGEAGIDMSREDPDQIGVLIGSGIGGLHLMEEQHAVVMERGPKRISPFLIPFLIVNMAAGMVSIRFGAKGPNSAVCTACASASHAIGDAFKILQRGDAQVMITGGTEASITPLGVGGFCAMGALSTRNDAPEKASRPFDKGRDGFVMGEGAGIVILETLEHATARGARILAEVVGYGMCGDAYHITSPAPDGEGAARCMRRALRDAGLQPQSIDYINAHGTSTMLNDKIETMAVKAVFSDHAHALAISSTKSSTGHLLGASGGIEFIASLLTIARGLIPPTSNYEVKDPDCDLDVVPNQARQRTVRMAMSNSFGFGGHNASLIIQKFSA